MKREILFKGKRVDNGEWVEGSLQLPNTDREETRIVSWNAVRYEVDPETVCQFTGLLDKNGNKIFEGDKINGNSNYEYTIIFNDYSFSAVHNSLIDHENLPLIWGKIHRFNECGIEIEIIGNIHD